MKKSIREERERRGAEVYLAAVPVYPTVKDIEIGGKRLYKQRKT